MNIVLTEQEVKEAVINYVVSHMQVNRRCHKIVFKNWKDHNNPSGAILEQQEVI